jgi:hypothetical protein
MRAVSLAIALLYIVLPSIAAAQDTAQATQAPAAETAQDDPDLDPRPAQPDFAIVNLPTTLRLPRGKSAFRVTHRFSRALGQGDAGDLAGDLFGLDSSAQIGLEYRYGLWSGLQVGIHRTSDKTIEFFGRYNLLNEADGRVVGLDVAVSVDGTNNFRDSYSPAVGAVVSKELGSFGAIYVEPTWINNSNLEPDELVDDNDTWMLGLGARIRVRPTVYVVAELMPRAGFQPGANHATFGIEKRAGGHVFQVNFSNGFGTTMGQLARGGTSNDDWYLGFNISRKFY